MHKARKYSKQHLDALPEPLLVFPEELSPLPVSLPLVSCHTPSHQRSQVWCCQIYLKDGSGMREL